MKPTSLQKSQKSLISPDYMTFVADLKTRIASAHLSAARSVNRELILLYWDIGQAIVEKQRIAKWGDSVVEQIAADLRHEFPDMRGFSTSNIWRILQLYEVFTNPAFLSQVVTELALENPQDLIWRQAVAKSDEAKLQQAVAELPETSAQGPIRQQAVAKLRGEKRSQAVSELKKTSALFPEQLIPEPNDCEKNTILAQLVREFVATIPWGHYVNVLLKIADPAALLYYLRATAQLGWSRNVLLNQVKAGAYERARLEKKTHNFELALPEHFAEQADEALTSRYNLEFLGISRAMKERDLETRLVERLQQFILELGYGFCFIGRQHRLALGEKEYFVDLLFYHRFLKTLVAFDLKTSAFEPEHAGKMDFYLNLLNDRERAPDDRPSIGIILCAEKDDVVVEFALKTKTNPIGVAEYQLQTKLPAEFKGKLPTAKQLTDALKGFLPLPAKSPPRQ